MNVAARVEIVAAVDAVTGKAPVDIHAETPGRGTREARAAGGRAHALPGAERVQVPLAIVHVDLSRQRTRRVVVNFAVAVQVVFGLAVVVLVLDDGAHHARGRVRFLRKIHVQIISRPALHILAVRVDVLKEEAGRARVLEPEAHCKAPVVVILAIRNVGKGDAVALLFCTLQNVLAESVVVDPLCAVGVSRELAVSALHLGACAVVEFEVRLRRRHKLARDGVGLAVAVAPVE